MALNPLKRLINPVVNYLGSKKEEKVFSQPPILIGGCGRSGTTLLLSILGAHPHIFALEKEATTFANWSAIQTEAGTPEYQPERLDRFYRQLLFSRISDSVTRWCEKTPRNVLHFDKILAYFDQQVKLIHIIRDGRDVMLSKHPTEPDKYWVSPERWVRDVQAGLEFDEHPQVLTIKYENLVLSYQQTVRKICEFLGEEYTVELQEWSQNTNVQDSKAWSAGVKRLHTQSVGKWKRSENKARVEEIMNYPEVVELLAELNYLEEEERSK